MSDNRDYKIEAVVLKWVKLRETDVIVKMVDKLGCLVEGVARGARKPNNSTSLKLEPFNCVEAFLVKGRGIDVIKDCRALQLNDKLRSDPCKFSCASCLGELLCKTLQPDTDVPKMFGLVRAYISALEEADESKRLCLTSAALLKASSYLGFMPSLNRCVMCNDRLTDYKDVAFSYIDGGILCKDCKNLASTVTLDPALLAVANAFLHMTFAQIAESGYGEDAGADVMRLACTWIKTQAGVNLKSYPLALEICAC